LRGTAPFVPATPAQRDTPGKEERLKRGKGAFLQETPTSLSPSPRKEIPLFPRVTAACWPVVAGQWAPVNAQVPLTRLNVSSNLR
jgi:hypothetical protein